MKYCKCGCGKKLENPKNKFILGHNAKFCPTKWKKGNSSWIKGLTKETDERVKRMSEIPRNKKWRDRISSSNKGRVISKETKEKISNTLMNHKSPRKGITMEEEYGSKKSKRIKGKISKTVKKRYKTDPKYKDRIKSKTKKLQSDEHKEEVFKQLKNLSSQGYHCIQLITRPIPDIIAIKDNKVFAVEVEMKHSENDFIPYLKYKDIDYFDDIFWIIKQSNFWRGQKKK